MKKQINKKRQTNNKTKIKTDWDFTILYKSDNDPQIEKDIKKFEKLCSAFEKKYRNNDKYLKTNGALLEAMKDYEEIKETVLNPLLYWYLKTVLNSSDIKAQAKLQQVEERYIKSVNSVAFFEINIGKVSEERKKKILNCRRLKKYRYFFEHLFLEAKHTLTEREEQLVALLEQPASQMWKQGVQKVLLKDPIEYKEKKLSFNEAGYKIPTLKKTEREKLYKKVMNRCIEVSDFAESELNAIYTTKKILDEKRNFKKPYSDRVLQNHDSEKMVETLVEVVTTNFQLSHRFYKIKAKLLNQKTLKYYDRAAEVGKVKTKYSYEKSYKIIKEKLLNADKQFSDILDSLVLNGYIDALNKKGKHTPGLISVNNTPEFIILNHNNTLNALTTFAHELGHAIHSKLSKNLQPSIYQDTSSSTGETASTFFEGLIFDEVVKELPESQKVIALHNKVQDSVQSIFRQTACFNFELEAHTNLREKGMLSKKELSNLMNKHMKKYLSNIFKLDEFDGYFWVQWPHLRTPFYVYTYAFGNLVSSALRHEYYQDPNFIENIKEFLSAGSSDTTENIFKKAGITINKKFFENGIQEIEKDIEELEKLV